MQAWTSLRLTPEPVALTIVSVGRPAKPESPSAYEAAFRDRVKTARKLFSDKSADMARALGVVVGTYNRYENRTMLPHYLIPKFCQLTGVEVEWLVSGPKPGRHARVGTHSPDSPTS
jgi:DNA-binding XRE family transcriptional regulator